MLLASGKAEASSKVVGQDMESSVGCVQFTVVGQAYMGLVDGMCCLPRVPKTTLASSGKAAGALGLGVEPKGASAVWSCWVGFNEC